MTNTYKYLFSVVMPFSNSENYLQEAIESVITQSIGFNDNIQLILINDGSSDSSEKICMRYKSQYPDNIIFLQTPYAGLYSARNLGIQYAEGRYINFFSPEDKWDGFAFEKVALFLEAHRHEIDFVSCKESYIDTDSGFKHPLDYISMEETVINTLENPDYIKLSVISTFIDSSSLHGISFEEKFESMADILFISRLLIHNPRYGVIPSELYFDRVVDYCTPCCSNNVLDSAYSLPFNQVFEECFSLSIAKYGKIIEYFQYLAMHEIRGRIIHRAPSFLNENELEHYISHLRAVLQRIDDKIISHHSQVSFGMAIFALNLKYEMNVIETSALEGSHLSINGTRIRNLRGINRLHIDVLEIRDNLLCLDGRTDLSILDDLYNLTIFDNDNHKYELSCISYENCRKYSFSGEVIDKGTHFHVELPLVSHRSYRFVLTNTFTQKSITLHPTYGRFAKLNNDINASYYSNSGFLVTKKKDELFTSIANKRNVLKTEFRYLFAMYRRKAYFDILRRLFIIIKMLLKVKKIWIVTDRSYAAGDNGEAIFRYLNSKPELLRNTNIYFAINRTCPDYMRMKKYGKVISPSSRRFFSIYILSDRILSSHGEAWIIDGFPEKKKYLRDFMKYRYTFLQHGIIMNDVSNILRKNVKNIDSFITAANAEYNSIVYGEYGYSSDEVFLTGLPRYDYLEDNKEKKITFLPTWRRNIVGKWLPDGSAAYNKLFKYSQYLAFYSKLINDPRITACMEKHGYIGEFYMHPYFIRQAGDLPGNEIIKVMATTADYRDVYAKSSLIITDYSSCVMDFAYLRKPVIYTQFDADSFFGSHYNKGYYDYVKDGFGPVCTDYESSVEAIIGCIEGGCHMEPQYQSRVSSFFAYTDKGNCERVYNAILEKESK